MAHQGSREDEGVLRSAQYDDVYFSAEDGLAETRYVFLKGNRLPERWTGRQRFVIGETGFGTGLNFLAAWAVFEQTAEHGQCLDFISFEKYPLELRKVEDALSIWNDALGEQMAQYFARVPRPIPGFHRIQYTPQISLTLIIGDVNEMMRILDASVDCWFLDGFRPATNPEMWSAEVFSQMARLSATGASVATFTAAGMVKRGLIDAGFNMQKVKGYGRKREMLVGEYTGGIS